MDVISYQPGKPLPVSITGIPLEDIRTDGGTQSRSQLNPEVISEYAEALKEGASFPQVTVFYDGTTHWLADGFHRYHAHVKAGLTHIPADVKQGSQRDAILHSVGANAVHGLRRTADDKRRAVMVLLEDPEWSKWPQTKIAQACGVSREYVSRLSSSTSVSCDRSQDSVRTVERGGKTYEIDTSNIGKAKEPVVEDATVPEGSSYHDGKMRTVERGGKPEKKPEAPARQLEEKYGFLTPHEIIEELEAAAESYEAEIKELKAENDKYADMKVQFEQGGYDKVVDGLKEELRVMKEGMMAENRSMIGWKNKARYWKEQALKLGWSNPNDIEI